MRTQKNNDFHKLRERLTKLLIQNEAGINNNEELAYVIELCERRDTRIFKLAQRAALYHIFRMESYMLGLYVSKVVRIDGAQSSQLIDVLLRAGAAKKHPDVNQKPEAVDLNKALNIEQGKTFLCYVSGESMIEANIYDGDLLIVNSKLAPKDGNIVVAEVDGNLLVKRYKIKGAEVWLYSENPDYPNINLNGELPYSVFGVVEHVIHNAK